jgi:hypothetical protein
MEVHNCNPGTLKVEAGGLTVQGYSWAQWLTFVIPADHSSRPASQKVNETSTSTNKKLGIVSSQLYRKHK